MTNNDNTSMKENEMKMKNGKSHKVTKRETVFKNVQLDHTCEITRITHNWSKFVAKFTAKGSFLVMSFNTVEACHKFFNSQIEKLGLGIDKDWMPRTTGSARWPNGSLRKNKWES